MDPPLWMIFSIRVQVSIPAVYIHAVVAISIIMHMHRHSTICMHTRGDTYACTLCMSMQAPDMLVLPIQAVPGGALCIMHLDDIT